MIFKNNTRKFVNTFKGEKTCWMLSVAENYYGLKWCIIMTTDRFKSIAWKQDWYFGYTTSSWLGGFSSHYPSPTKPTFAYSYRLLRVAVLWAAYKINHIYLATWIKLGQDVWCWSSVYCVPWIFLNALCIFSKHYPGRDQSSPCFRWGNRRTKNNASRLQLHVAKLGFNPRMLDSRAYNLVLALEDLTS